MRVPSLAEGEEEGGQGRARAQGMVEEVFASQAEEEARGKGRGCPEHLELELRQEGVEWE